MPNTIRNPIEYMVDEVTELAHGVGLAGKSLQRTSAHMFTQPLAIQRITVGDLKDVLKKGYSDLGAYRTDVIFLIGIYPLVIVLAAAAAFNAELIPLVFPIISGTAIMGPFVGVLLYEMSRRREIAELRHHEEHYSWTDALSIVKSRNFGAIVMLGLILVALYAIWLGTAYAIYRGLQGPQPLESFGYFVQGLFETQAGWWMIGLGWAVGFLFAALAAGHRRGVVPAAARPGGCRPRHRDLDLDPRHVRQPGAGRGLGPDCDGGLGARRHSAVHRAGGGDAGAVPRDVASLSQAAAAPNAQARIGEEAPLSPNLDDWAGLAADRGPGDLVHPVQFDLFEAGTAHQLRDLVPRPVISRARQQLVEHDLMQMP